MELNPIPYVKRKKTIPMALDPKDLFNIICKINKLNTLKRWDLTALSSLLYLTGARISEALALRKRDFRIDENGTYLFNLRTLKAKIYPIREIPIFPNKTDAPFFDIVKAWLDQNLDSKSDEDFLFPFRTRFSVNDYLKNVWIDSLVQLDVASRTWIEKPFRLHPHYFRHCRFSHLASIFQYTELELMKFAGWSSTKPAIFYVKLSYKDLLRKMIMPEVVSDYVKRYLEKATP